MSGDFPSNILLKFYEIFNILSEERYLIRFSVVYSINAIDFDHFLLLPHGVSIYDKISIHFSNVKQTQ
jgi:hypothetical protein